ncbi:MAG: dehydrogenase [Deltaproteobacteria bacterium]|nr:MAG: dehydrogenase [Deltaproteobacteria bacterium]
MDLYEEIVRLKKLGRHSALATIVECKGSSPQKQGAKMLVREDGSTLGTLGGGCVEADVVLHSLRAMQDRRPRTLPFELIEEESGLVCGGTILVFIEPVLPDPHLVILGAGHVGKMLTRLASFTGFRVTVIDDRAEYANRENLPEATDLLVRDFDKAFDGMDLAKETFIVVATRGHNHDLEALQAALKTAAGYVGLLGSRRKKALLFKALAESGFSREDIGRVIIPVGLDIGSTTPEEIAVSIMAQIIQERRAYGARGSGAAACGGLVPENRDPETAAAVGE